MCFNLNCTLAKVVQIFPGPGLYSGIFAMYLQCPSNKSRTAVILYAVCLLYVLSTVTFVTDLVALILEVSNRFICKDIIFLNSVVQTRISTLSLRLQSDSQPMLFRLMITQTTASGCCDFISQCIIVRINHFTYHPFYSPKSSKIYRCWIVWGQNIRVVVIPSFLAIAFLGQSIYFHLISRLQFIASESSYLASGDWRNDNCTRPIFDCYLGGPCGFIKLLCVHGREYLGNRLDRVQDPQGVLGSQAYFGRANFGHNRR